MSSQRKMTEKKKARGMAPLDPVAHRKRLRKVRAATVTPGKKQATRQHTLAQPSYERLMEPHSHTAL